MISVFTFHSSFSVMIFRDSSAGKQSACNAGDPCLIPGSGRSPGEGIGYPLQFSWASLVAQLIKNLPATGGTWVWSLGWEDPWRRERLSTPVFWPAEFHGLYRPWGSQSQTRLSDFHFPIMIVVAFVDSWVLDHFLLFLFLF